MSNLMLNYTGRRWKMVCIEAGASIELAYANVYVTSSGLSSTNYFLLTPRKGYINISDLKTRQWRESRTVQPLVAEVVAEDEHSFVVYLPQPFLRVYVDWDYESYQANVAVFKAVLGASRPGYTEGICLRVLKSDVSVMLPFDRVGHEFKVWQGKWSSWYNWDVFFDPEGLKTLGLDMSYVQTYLVQDPNIYLDLQGFRLSIHGKGCQGELKVYPRAKKLIETAEDNVKSTFEDAVIDSVGLKFRCSFSGMNILHLALDCSQLSNIQG